MKCRHAVEKVDYYELAQYIAKVIDISRDSPEYQYELFEKSNFLFDQSCAHIFVNSISTSQIRP